MKKLKNFGAAKNSITGKTIREMTWNELLGLPVTERLTTAEAIQRMKEARASRDNSQLV